MRINLKINTYSYNIYNMSVQIKPLKGFKNHLNGENNTLSLLIKSDYELSKHLLESKQKLSISLTSIINHYKNVQKIHFYHKLQIPLMNKSDYITTKWYELSFNSLKMNLDDSFKNLISMCKKPFCSHFINVIIEKDDNVMKLSDEKFQKINHIIRTSLSKINNKKPSFVDDNPFEEAMMNIKERNLQLKKQIKIINEKYLSLLRQYIEYLTL